MKVNFKSIIFATILAVTSYCLGALTTSTLADPLLIEHNDGRYKERSTDRDNRLQIGNGYNNRYMDSLRTHLGVVQDGKNTYAIYYLTNNKYNDVNKNGEQDYKEEEATIPQYIYQRELVK